jgi:hypothetical protein
VKLTWRQYRPEDAADVVELHVEQEAVLGRKMDLPNMMEKPVLETHVAVNESGEVVGGFYFEAVPEVCFFGVSPHVTASAVRDAAAPVLEGLRKRGFRMVRLLVPKEPEKVAERIDEELQHVGFARTDAEYATYIFDLR